jgi:hypothetical protein
MKVGVTILAAVVPVLVSADSTVVANGNPHTNDECTGPECQCAAQAISPLTLLHGLYHPNKFQDEQLLKIDTVQAFGQEIPIYHFKQPSELNPDQLPFKIALLNQNMPLENVVFLNTDEESATNSWFPEYHWSITVCTKNGGRHLGWKFVNKAKPEQYFHAMIVDYDEKEEVPGIMQKIIDGLRVAGQPLIATGLTLAQVNRMTKTEL